ncbi:hypothetical protein ABZ445_16095 [Streptomyces chartreusis]|uniref:hypothetical protein n=1 Tax=Streptomyces chartreusis TaxID=1969 RepID=UPI0033D74E45
MNKLRTYLNDLTLRAVVALQTFAATEPVRLRSLLMSGVLAAGLLFPALREGNVALTISTIGAVALPIAVGESARNRVSPL